MQTEGFETAYSVIAELQPEQDKEKLRELYGWFREFFLTQVTPEFSSQKQDEFFTDWVCHCRKLGFRIQDYFDYELYNKDPGRRKEFIGYRYRKQIIRDCICREDRLKYLDDKAAFDETFAEFMGRDWLDVSCCTYEEMKKFCFQHPHFFAKQKRGQGGEGARCYRNMWKPSQELFSEFRDKEMILEEYVRQHPAIAAFNPDTLNTIRVLTLTDVRGEAHIMLAAGRFGRAGGTVDNFHGGGIVVEVDPETGTITSDGVDRVHRKYPVHPDSGKAFEGFVYPAWEQVKKTVLAAAEKIPKLRHIGWDVAVTRTRKVILIEGNGRPDMNMMQMAGQRGKKQVYEDLITEIEKQDRGRQHG